MKVTSSEAQQHFGRYQAAAQQNPVSITRNGQPHTVLVSASFFDMVLQGRIARAVEDLDEETLAAIANSNVPSEHADLDQLLDGWNP